jgi:hypothetical protein
MIRKRKTGNFRREFSSVHEARKHDASGALDVIVEDGIGVSEEIEVSERVFGGEVLLGCILLVNPSCTRD